MATPSEVDPAPRHRDGDGGTAPRWRVLGTERADAATLLTRGRALLDGLVDDPVPTLRWYRATDTALVLGRGQGRVALGARDGLPVVTRHSGGGAVLMDPSLLSLDVLLPAGHPWLAEDDLSAVFLVVGRRWAAALSGLGLDDVAVHTGPGTARRRGTPREQLRAAVCYATLGRGEVTVRGRKLLGLSQRRRRHGALVQCGLLERWAPAPLLGPLGAAVDDAEILHAAVGLEDLTGRPVDEAQVRALVEAAFGAGGGH